jgi:hypothetical protein
MRWQRHRVSLEESRKAEGKEGVKTALTIAGQLQWLCMVAPNRALTLHRRSSDSASKPLVRELNPALRLVMDASPMHRAGLKARKVRHGFKDYLQQREQ